MRRTIFTLTIAVAGIGALLTLAPLRTAASEFLSVFRVRKFAVVEIDPTALQHMQALAEQDVGALLGEPEVLREPGEPRLVEDLAAAQALVDFGVREPAVLGRPDSVHVVDGMALRFTLDPAALGTLYALAELPAAGLPDEVSQVHVETGDGVGAMYLANGAPVFVYQVPSPVIELPEGLDPSQLGRLMLQLMGVKPAEALRLAETLDWTSTMVIPVPVGAASYQEVEVDGTRGLLLALNEAQYNQFGTGRAVPAEPGARSRPFHGWYSEPGVDSGSADMPGGDAARQRDSATAGMETFGWGGHALLWERDGVIYVMGGLVRPQVLTVAASSMR